MRRVFWRLLWAAMLALGWFSSANAVTLSGSVNNPDGTGVTGRLYLSLSQQSSQLSTGGCGGPAVLVPTAQVVLLITNGALTTLAGGSASIVGNDCIAPTNTYYVVTARDAQNNPLFTQNWQITVANCGSPCDVGKIPPSVVPQGTLVIGAGYFTMLTVTGGGTLTGMNLVSPAINGTPTGTGVPTITYKQGSGSGTDYTSTSISPVKVDATNLQYTVTIPTGWKLLVQANGIISQSTAVVGVDVALFDGSTAIDTRFLVTSGATSVWTDFSLSAVVNGDGVSHTIALEFDTTTAADAVHIANNVVVAGVAGNNYPPKMVFILVPSN